MTEQEMNNKTSQHAHTKITLLYIGLFALKFHSNSLHLIAQFSHYISTSSLPQRGPGCSVGIATDYGLKIRNRIPVGTRFSALQSGPGAHPASCKMGTGSFPGVKCGRGMLLPTHPLLVPRSWKSRAIPLPTLWATPGL